MMMMMIIIIIIIIRTGVTEILNVDLNEDQWLQASLLVGGIGLTIRTARMLTASVFLSSAESTLLLQQFILSDSIWAPDDQAIESTESLLANLANRTKLAAEVHHTQNT